MAAMGNGGAGELAVTGRVEPSERRVRLDRGGVGALCVSSSARVIAECPALLPRPAATAEGPLFPLLCTLVRTALRVGQCADASRSLCQIPSRCPPPCATARAASLIMPQTMPLLPRPLPRLLTRRHSTPQPSSCPPRRSLFVRPKRFERPMKPYCTRWDTSRNCIEVSRGQRHRQRRSLCRPERSVLS